MNAYIITDRLSLRYVTQDDVAAIQSCILDPRIYEKVAGIPANQPQKATENWISTHVHARVENTDYVYAILREEKFIGLIGIHRKTPSDFFEIGFWSSPEAWGQGYMTEAGQAVLRDLETTLGPQKTVSGYFEDNLASGRVLEKLGYTTVGTGQMHCAGLGKLLPYIRVERAATL